MMLIGQIAGNTADIVIVYKAEQMFATIKCPVFGTKLTQERVYDLKHIHGVEAGEQSLVTFVVCGRMQHGIIHQAVVIAVKHFSY